jgi:hypothetical protein
MSAFPEAVSKVVSGLQSIGYQGALLEENYKFADWFSPQNEERSVAAAAFGQTPISYDSACIGVVCANGIRGHELINRHRALGAPIFLEVAEDEIKEWAVSRTENSHGLVDTYPVLQLDEMFAARASDWKPHSLLRSKNIGSYTWNQQLALFVGLLPELEEQIQQKLDPLLRHTLARTREAYQQDTKREPNETQLFQLIFGILTAKVFYDRQVPGFSKLSGDDADELLAAVAKH